MSDLPQRLRENVTMEYDRTDDVMLEAADRIEADEALMRQALEELANARDHIWLSAENAQPLSEAEMLEKLQTAITALHKRLGEKP